MLLFPTSPKERKTDILIADILGGNEKDEEEPLDLDNPQFGQTADFDDDATPDLDLSVDDLFEGKILHIRGGNKKIIIKKKLA